MSDCPSDRALPEDFSVRALEDVFFRKDGSQFDVLCVASPIFKDGKPSSTVLEVRDVTQQKAAARESAESKQRLELSMSAGRLGAWEWNIKTDEVIWSPQLYDLFGYTPSTFDGSQRSFINMVHPDDRQRVGQTIHVWWSYDAAISQQLQDAFQRALTGKTVRYDVVIRMAGDTRMMIDFMLVPVTDADGKIRHVIPAGVDISERIAGERTIREANAKLEAMFKQSVYQMGILSLDVVLTEINKATTIPMTPTVTPQNL